MVSRGSRRLALLAAPTIVVLYLACPLFTGTPAIPFDDVGATTGSDNSEQTPSPPVEDAGLSTSDGLDENLLEFQDAESDVGGEQADPEDWQTPSHLTPSHQKVFSLSSPENKFIPIDFGPYKAYNPSIIPHPTLADTWIAVAQEVNDKEASTKFFEIACNAAFQDGRLACAEPPTRLPIAATAGRGCEGELAYMDLSTGPHDARVFMSPHGDPYIMYGSNSQFTCFGCFVQDLRSLTDDFDDSEATAASAAAAFRVGTEVQRPPPYAPVEKNFFLFWDSEGNTLAHYDVAPRRVFSYVGQDGLAGPDLGPAAGERDEKCLQAYVPELQQPEHESIHQATNSLQVTLCDRADPSCVADDSNTVIIAVYQHKRFYGFHSVYEPYVMAFRRRAPFELYGLSRRPLWINGREEHAEKDTSDMFYVTAMSWKGHGRDYHGHLDDELFVAFGIEDTKSAAVDLTAAHLLEGLSLCPV